GLGATGILSPFQLARALAYRARRALLVSTGARRGVGIGSGVGSADRASASLGLGRGGWVFGFSDAPSAGPRAALQRRSGLLARDPQRVAEQCQGAPQFFHHDGRARRSRNAPGGRSRSRTPGAALGHGS